jgi:hypothetical protein
VPRYVDRERLEHEREGGGAPSQRKDKAAMRHTISEEPVTPAKKPLP